MYNGRHPPREVFRFLANRADLSCWRVHFRGPQRRIFPADFSGDHFLGGGACALPLQFHLSKKGGLADQSSMHRRTPPPHLGRESPCGDTHVPAVPPPALPPPALLAEGRACHLSWLTRSPGYCLPGPRPPPPPGSPAERNGCVPGTSQLFRTSAEWVL